MHTYTCPHKPASHISTKNAWVIIWRRVFYSWPVLKPSHPSSKQLFLLAYVTINSCIPASLLHRSNVMESCSKVWREAKEKAVWSQHYVLSYLIHVFLLGDTKWLMCALHWRGWLRIRGWVCYCWFLQKSAEAKIQIEIEEKQEIPVGKWGKLGKEDSQQITQQTSSTGKWSIAPRRNTRNRV